MALITTHLVSAGPRVRKRKGTLVAVTGWKVWLMTFGLSNRTVVVDPDKKEVRVRDRAFWFFRRSKKYRFALIRAVSYSYGDGSGGSGWSAHDAIDVFSVGLKLQDDNNEKIHLFVFFGDGAFTNEGPMPDWMYWEEYLTDIEGTQEQESRAFVTMLSKMICVPTEPR